MQPFIKSVLPPTCSIRSDPKRGRGMFAEKDFAKGEVIFTEKPLCAMQHVENRAMAWTCANCFAFLGTLEAQLASLQTYCNINTDRNLQLPQSSALHKAPTAVVECVGGCGEKYCSEECRNQAYSEHHQLLCVGPITDPNHPLVLFKQYAIANNELFLLAAQILSRIIMYRKAAGGVKEGSDPTAVFHNKVWWEVVNLDCGVATDDLKKMLNDTLELLRQALLVPILAQFPGAPIEDVFTFDFWARLVGMLEINDNSIDIDSPLYTYYLAIDEFKPQSKKAAQKALNPLVERLEQLQQEEEGEDDAEMGDDAGEASNAGDDHMHHEHHEHDDHMHEDDDDEDEEEPIIPRFTGLGVFPTEAMLNHSCEPNCTIKFPTNHLAHIVATKDIKKGEEILHCYIENKQPVEDRQYDLFEYGFQCECPKCQRDLAAKK